MLAVELPICRLSYPRLGSVVTTLKDILAKTCGDLRWWDENLEWTTFFYNASVNLTTGFAPTKLATGRKPMVPWEGSAEAHPARKTHLEYVDEQLETMRRTSKAVYETTRMNQAVQRREFDKRIHGKPLEVGDLVRVKFQGKAEEGVTTKLMSRWRGPYEIVEKIGDKTYIVMMEYKGEMRPRVVNFRNMWKVGRKIGLKEEADLEGFVDEELEDEVMNETAAKMENLEIEDDDDVGDGAEERVMETEVEGADGSAETRADANDETRLKVETRKNAETANVKENVGERNSGNDNVRQGPIFTRFGRRVKPREILDL